MRPQIRHIRRRAFVQDYLLALVSDGGFDLKTGGLIYRSLISSSPIELCQLGRTLDSGLVMGVAPISLADSLDALGIPSELFGRRCFNVSFDLRTSCPQRIKWLRQVLLFSKKFPDDPIESSDVTLASFANRIHVSGRPTEVLQCDRDICARLLGRVPVVAELTNCKHGPGAVRDGERSVEKWNWTASTPYDSNFFCNDLHELDHRKVSLPSWRRTCRAITVPKDYRRDRVIAIESKEVMFISQGVKHHLYERLANASDRQIEFNSQESHRELLRNPDYVSLDLSDASDMVSRRLCYKLLPREWFSLCNSLRSSVVLCNNKPIRSRAMYTMGNALCFPIEALVHYVAVRRVVPSYMRVSVYGDDIIVPKRYATWVMETLRAFGLKPSDSKCCFRTTFKESCGLDLYQGMDVTPAYLRLGHSGITNAVNALQLVSFQRHHWESGLYNAARMVAEAITNFINYPSTPYPHPWKLGGENIVVPRSRFNTNLQVLQYRIPVLITHRVSQLSGWNALLAWFYTGSSECFIKRDVPRLRYTWLSDIDHIGGLRGFTSEVLI